MARLGGRLECGRLRFGRGSADNHYEFNLYDESSSEGTTGEIELEGRSLGQSEPLRRTGG